MKSSARKAVILNNLTSPYIYQAIVILSEQGAKNENKALEDAERIVTEYLSKQKNDENEDILLYSRQKSSVKRNRLGSFLLCCGILFLALLLGALIFRR